MMIITATAAVYDESPMFGVIVTFEGVKLYSPTGTDGKYRTTDFGASVLLMASHVPNWNGQSAEYRDNGVLIRLSRDGDPQESAERLVALLNQTHKDRLQVRFQMAPAP